MSHQVTACCSSATRMQEAYVAVVAHDCIGESALTAETGRKPHLVLATLTATAMLAQANLICLSGSDVSHHNSSHISISMHQAACSICRANICLRAEVHHSCSLMFLCT